MKHLKKQYQITIQQAVWENIAWLEIPKELPFTTQLIASYDHDEVATVLAENGVKPPIRLQDSLGGGFCQYLPQE